MQFNAKISSSLLDMVIHMLFYFDRLIQTYGLVVKVGSSELRDMS